ncbi:YcxB-like protein [Alteromonas sp. 38]|uniref:YcxB family protein n=1 Tax=unclassified Alteromonas TaxID=2614992 RepID=UPI0012EF98E7|nr:MULTISPECIES: YcxB family protein [unclassified Alteromonas]CAD5292321.1 YcxB-like protein [Alteromonas sp. 154]VXB15536.1 YcxB-like protein [Alteromonas sp. 38]
MEITTNIVRSDLLKLNLSVALRSKGTYYFILGISLLVLCFSFYKSGLPDSPVLWATAFFIALFSGFLGAAPSFAINVFCLLIMSKQSNGVLGTHIYQISEAGLFEKTDANETLTKWSGVLSVKVHGPILYIQIAPGLFHTIPSRSFSDSKAFIDFANAARKFWEHA